MSANALGLSSRCWFATSRAVTFPPHPGRMTTASKGRKARRRRSTRTYVGRAAGRLDSVDRPGVAGLEEAFEVALALVGACALELLFHLAVVHRALDVAEDADRGRPVRRVREPGDRRSQRRSGRPLVVHEQRVLSHLGDVDDLGRGVFAEPHAALSLRAEADRLALLERDPVLLLVANRVEGAVVVDVAVLVDLDEGRSLVSRGAAQDLRQVPAVGVDRAADERRLRPE